MIKDNQKLLNKIHLLMDALVIVIAYVLAWIIRFELGGVTGGVLPKEDYFAALLVLVPGYLFLYSAFQLYTPKRTTRTRIEIFTLFKANSVGLFGYFAALYLMHQEDFSRGMIAIFYVLNLALASGYRVVLRDLLRHFRKKGYNLKHVLLVGYSRAAEQYIERIKQNPSWGYHIMGVLDDHIAQGVNFKGIEVIGEVDQIYKLLPENNLDEIAITLSLSDYDRLEEIVSFCEKSGVHTKFIPDYNAVIPTKPYTEDLDGLPVINIRNVPLNSGWNQFLKRSMDLFGTVVACIIFSPVMLVCAVLIKLTSDGPVLFRQERIGLHNKPFYMYKFRSMRLQTEADEKKGWTVKNDPRVTGIGKFMRRTSIDELPQLFNILKGDMSLIGPRPERPQFVEKFKEEIPRYMVKHQVRPGLTGWAQVNGYRGDTSIRKRIDCDIYYIENWTLGLDIKILILTFFKGFINKNAY